ncbi:hypothetical protein X943_002607 [Babesia divergens]|uniref:Uncharacterized protein n=1 Tax=Babesia divergens TaxID=32595 RepID=A0AAD9LDW5_BABDI|nr:hypothetical protein X943_002607 [Babesia divergens]
MNVSRTLITVALCLVSLGHSGRGVLGDNSVGRRLSTQEDVSAGMLGVSDQGEPVPSGFFGSVENTFKKLCKNNIVFRIGMIVLIVLCFISGIAVGCTDKDSTGWYVGGFLVFLGALCFIYLLVDIFYPKSLHPVNAAYWQKRLDSAF